MRTELEEYPEIELALQEVGMPSKCSSSKKGGLVQVNSQSQSRVEAESRQSQGRVRAESTKNDILEALSLEPLSKAEIAKQLSLNTVTGHLNRIIRSLLEDGLIEYTIPEKPNSRLQKYRLCDKPPVRG